MTFTEQCGRSLAGSLVLPYVSVTLPGWLPGFLSMVQQFRNPEEHSEHPSDTVISSAATVLLFLEKHLTSLTVSMGQALRENV